MTNATTPQLSHPTTAGDPSPTGARPLHLVFERGGRPWPADGDDIVLATRTSLFAVGADSVGMWIAPEADRCVRVGPVIRAVLHDVMRLPLGQVDRFELVETEPMGHCRRWEVLAQVGERTERAVVVDVSLTLGCLEQSEYERHAPPLDGSDPYAERRALELVSTLAPLHAHMADIIWELGTVADAEAITTWATEHHDHLALATLVASRAEGLDRLAGVCAHVHALATELGVNDAHRNQRFLDALAHAVETAPRATLDEVVRTAASNMATR